MEQLDEITVRTSYAKLFESIQEDFGRIVGSRTVGKSMDGWKILEERWGR